MKLLFELTDSLSFSEKKAMRNWLTTSAPALLCFFDDLLQSLSIDTVAARISYLSQSRKQEEVKKLGKYLEEEMLTFLRNKKSKNPQIQILKKYQETLILLDRDLTKAAARNIKMLKAKAQKFGLDSILLEINVLERQIIRKTPQSISGRNTNLPRLAEEGQKICDQITQYQKALFTYDHLFLIINDPITNKNRIPDTLLLAQKNLTEITQKHSSSIRFAILLQMAEALLVQLRELHSLSDGSHTTRYAKEAAQHYYNILEIFDSNTHLLSIPSFQKSYLATINNYFSLLFKSGIILQNFDHVFQRLESSTIWKKTLVKKLPVSISYFKILVAFAQNDYQSIVNQSTYIEGLLATPNNMISQSRAIAFYYYIAFAHTMNGDGSKALEHISKIDLLEKPKIRSDIQLMGKILTIMIFIQREDYDLAEFKIMSARAFFRRHCKGLVGIHLILKFFQKFIQSRKFETLSSLKAKLSDFGIFPEICNWIDSLSSTLGTKPSQ